MASSRNALPLGDYYEVELKWDGRWYTENQNGGTLDQAMEWYEDILKANPEIPTSDIRVVRSKRQVTSEIERLMKQTNKRVRGS